MSDNNVNLKKSENEKNQKKKKSMLPVAILFLIGLLVLCYPAISGVYNKIKFRNVNVTFDHGAKKLGDDEVKRRMKLARYYNAAIENPNISDPFIRKNHEEGLKEYARMLQIKESIGYIEIPKIHQSLPIYPGTGEDILQIGVGHMRFTSLPIGGIGTHCVLTAHSGLPTAKLFTDIDKLKTGDIFLIHNLKEVLAYEVDSIKVIEPTNYRPLEIVKDRDYCTLFTCTPYMINTHRLLVRGRRTDYVRANRKDKSKIIIYIIIAAAAVILLLLFLFIRRRKKNRKKEKVE